MPWSDQGISRKRAKAQGREGIALRRIAVRLRLSVFALNGSVMPWSDEGMSRKGAKAQGRKGIGPR